MFDLTGKVAVITGGAGLLGREFAKALLTYGAKVILWDVNKQKGQEALEDIRADVEGQIDFIKTDITDKKSIQSAVETILDKDNGIDVLINNAALDPKFAGDAAKHSWTFEDYPLELWNQAVAVNLTGAFLCCQIVGEKMAAQQKGVVINVASELGVIAPDHRIYIKKDAPEKREFKPVDYPVTKAALIHLTKYLAAYWGEKNIRVNSLCPAAVNAGQDGELVENIEARTVLGRMSRKDEFGAALVFLASDASSYMTGANLVLDGGRTII